MYVVVYVTGHYYNDNALSVHDYKKFKYNNLLFT